MKWKMESRFCFELFSNGEMRFANANVSCVNDPRSAGR